LHSSKPEHVSDGEDPWHVEELKKKTEKLERMVDEKTAELIKKNEELEIETGLERVRAVAMGMAKSEDLLNICEVSYKEFRKLGFENLRNALIHIPNDEKKYFMDYDFSDFTGGQIGKVEYGLHPIVDEYLEKMRSAAEAYFEVVINKDQLSDWKEFRINSGQSDDPRLDETEALYYYLFSIGIGDIGISTFKPIHESQIKILKRFRNVFDLAYRRYKDIAQAEAQTREAQIQLSLERVRARSMAMQSSNEIPDAANLLFHQLQELGMPTWSAGYGVFDEDQKGVTNWMSSEGILQPPFHAPLTEDPTFKQFSIGLKKGKPLHIWETSGEKLVEHYQYMMKLPVVGEIIKEVKAAGHSLPTYQINHLAFHAHGFLLFITYEPVPEAHEIFKRFAKVFEQTYTRFLDLQKAEAQAREAQIEAALERVRARTMAMQHSDELPEAALLLFSQIQSLGIPAWSAGYNILEADNKSCLCVMSSEGLLQTAFNLPLTEENSFLEWYEAIKRRDSFFVQELGGKQLNDHYDYLMNLPGVREAIDPIEKAGISLPTYQINHLSFFSHGFLLFITYKEVPDAHDIFKRFTKVFEQTYTRFLDLQKAEAQARESEIELALERVRARTMAMQKSDELQEAAIVLFEQVKILGFDTGSCGFNIWEKDEKAATVWVSSPEGGLQMPFKLPHTKSEIYKQVIRAMKNRADYFSIAVEGKKLTKHFDYLLTLPGIGDIIAKLRDANYAFPEKIVYQFAFFKQGYLSFHWHREYPDSIDIFKRFAKVFEQTYTRFLDLKNAEAQARESQIEAALERVRASALAMHKSEEVGAVSDMLFSELNKLNFDVNGCSIVVIDEEKDKMELWRARSNIAVKPFASTSFSESMELLKKYMPDWYTTFIKALGKRKNYLTDELSADRRSLFINAIAEQYQYSDTEKAQLDKNTPHKFTTHYIFFKLGYLALLSEKKLSEENLSIARRFIEVFDFAYTRFLDINKAEAQAREAQIETGLERVRARTMAMQKSNELAQTAAHLFAQMNELGIKPPRGFIAIVDKELKNCNIWSTTNNGNVIPTGSALPLDEYPLLQEMYDGWKTQRLNHSIELVGSKRLDWTKYISKHLPFEEYKEKNINEEELIKETAFFTNLYFKQGFFTIHSKNKLTEDQIKVIQRFAYVFEQTYTRFLDLENAEKQNKIIQAENQRKTEELEEARQLQLAMLPKELPQLPNLDIAVFMKTATEVGGDYYDFHVDNKGVLTAVIGDATGHGMKAGTIVTITKSMFNSLSSEKNILKVFSQISQVIRDMKFRQLSMCLMMLKIYENKLQISSAAMPPAYIYRSSKKKVDEIVLNGMPLGALPSFPYKIEETILNSGDTILLMSDGYPELMNDKGKMFGYEKALKIFEELAHTQSEEIIEGLKISASEWVQNKMPDDDVTFVVIKIK
jgi:hypothetical protein